MRGSAGGAGLRDGAGDAQEVAELGPVQDPLGGGGGFGGAGEDLAQESGSVVSRWSRGGCRVPALAS